MSLEFLIEVGCEEIPARCIHPILEQLRQRLENVLRRHSLGFDGLETFATPRRLILHVTDLSPSQSDQVELVIGPPISVALDQDRIPTKAAEGFARKLGVTSADLIRFKNEKGEYLGHERRIPGRSSKDILAVEVPGLFENLELSKNMRWDSSGFTFIRPIRWILCLLGGEVLDVRLANVSSGAITYGHRILVGNVSIEVNNFESFRSSLLNYKVDIDTLGRSNKIAAGLSSLATISRGTLVSDPELLGTVSYLSEHPTVICGSFDPAYLRIPKEVLVTVMKEHQKYFSLQDETGRLLPKFLAVVDSDEEHHPLIVKGHERVLRARLADADFFWEQDRRVQLEERVERLRHIVFHVKLGSLFDKTRRIVQLSQFLAMQLGKPELKTDVALAARLCKSDLTTEMVKEFTNLQGIMGGLYAKAEGVTKEVAEAIYDHYLPSSLEGVSPRNILGAILSICDKLDSVTAAFSIGLVPSGSKDPLALRRQTMGIIKTLLDWRLPISVGKLVHKALMLLKRFSSRSIEETYDDYTAFFTDRLRFVFREQGYRYDEINAILAVESDNPIDCFERLRAISLMRGSQDFISLATSFKRIKNILVKGGISLNGPFRVDPTLFLQEEEQVLAAAVYKIRPVISKLRRSRDYGKVFELMAALRPQVDRFFDKVLVMAEDREIQQNRLGLIGSLLEIFLRTADISEIVVG